MFVGCLEISKSVIVKHVQIIGIIKDFCLPEGTCYDFQYLGGQKLLGCGLLEEDQYPSWYYGHVCVWLKLCNTCAQDCHVKNSVLKSITVKCFHSESLFVA